MDDDDGNRTSRHKTRRPQTLRQGRTLMQHRQRHYTRQRGIHLARHRQRHQPIRRIPVCQLLQSQRKLTLQHLHRTTRQRQVPLARVGLQLQQHPLLLRPEKRTVLGIQRPQGRIPPEKQIQGEPRHLALLRRLRREAHQLQPGTIPLHRLYREKRQDSRRQTAATGRGCQTQRMDSLKQGTQPSGSRRQEPHPDQPQTRCHHDLRGQHHRHPHQRRRCLPVRRHRKNHPQEPPAIHYGPRRKVEGILLLAGRLVHLHPSGDLRHESEDRHLPQARDADSQRHGQDSPQILPLPLRQTGQRLPHRQEDQTIQKIPPARRQGLHQRPRQELHRSRRHSRQGMDYQLRQRTLRLQPQGRHSATFLGP